MLRRVAFCLLLVPSRGYLVTGGSSLHASRATELRSCRHSMMSAEYRTVLASMPTEAAVVAKTLSGYAADAEFGAGKAFSAEHQAELAAQLAGVPGSFSVLTYCGDKAVGVATCFMGFSTWKCAPLVNVHDIYVNAEHRRRGICSAMLKVVDDVAKERGCCKVTLEVLPTNPKAQSAYKKHGFEPYEINGAPCVVYQKQL
jgi:ribosomal protein S18 acetylase RimI-like enzyme